MSNSIVKVFSILAAVLFISLTVLELNAEARAGGSRSSGSRGSKSYSRPAPTYQQPAQARPQAATPPSTYQQQGGGFMRSMAGGLMGGSDRQHALQRFCQCRQRNTRQQRWRNRLSGNNHAGRRWIHALSLYSETKNRQRLERNGRPTSDRGSGLPQNRNTRHNNKRYLQSNWE